MQIDLKSSGLAMVFKDYQQILMKNLWKTDKEYSSRDAWVKVNEELRKEGAPRESISRASVINFLNSMVDESIIGFYEITGKGGYRRIYSAAKTEKEFWEYIAYQVQWKIVEASGDPNVFTFKGIVVKKE